MRHETILMPAYVIKAEELSALNYLPAAHPQPQEVEWINRGTDQKLKHSSVEMLKRTLSRDVLSPSVVRLHRSAGLRIAFRSEKERNTFATMFATAREEQTHAVRYHQAALFDRADDAERAILELKDNGVPEKAISLLWRAGQFMDGDLNYGEGHSKLSIASAAAGGGVAGAVLGIALLTIPGVGPVAAAGAIAVSAFSSVGAVSSIIGATGGVIARMLTDFDVDGVSATYYDQHIKRGKVFVAVDTRVARDMEKLLLSVFKKHGGKTTTRG